jgi:hypothetical protein
MPLLSIGALRFCRSNKLIANKLPVKLPYYLPIMWPGLLTLWPLANNFIIKGKFSIDNNKKCGILGNCLPIEEAG